LVLVFKAISNLEKNYCINNFTFLIVNFQSLCYTYIVLGYIIKNRYLNTDGGQNAVRSLIKAFKNRGVTLQGIECFACHEVNLKKLQGEFALFFDKDIILANFLKKSGIRVINAPLAIALTDDKAATYVHLSSFDKVKLIPTIYGPLSYQKQKIVDGEFLDFVQKQFSYPIVVKHNTGSLGKQVFLAKNCSELKKLFLANSNIPHQYQSFIDCNNSDIRIYTIGGKVVASIKRFNSRSFISNASCGGEGEKIVVPNSLKETAEFIARELNLDYGAIDFLFDGSQYYFLEANSNAYFTLAEKLGIDIAGKLADFICNK